jgi:cobalamin biosynthesis Mg chelatase CobN
MLVQCSAQTGNSLKEESIMNDTVDPAVVAAQKEAEKQAKAQAKADAKAARDAANAEKKAAKDAEKAEKAAKREADKAAKVQAKLDAKAAAVAAKEAGKMPEQNGVRRPKPETTCGKCWAEYDRLASERGGVAAIGDAKPALEAQGINEATIRTQYAHWRKFNGITGRVESVAKPVEQPTT